MLRKVFARVPLVFVAEGIILLSLWDFRPLNAGFRPNGFRQIPKRPGNRARVESEPQRRLPDAGMPRNRISVYFG
jgi:hypothetical protein